MCTVTPQHSINDCPPGVPHNSHLKVYGDSCYQFITNHQRQYGPAERECESHGGHLVVIRNSMVQQFLYNTLYHELGFRGDVFIGLTDKVREGHWIWLDGKKLLFRYCES